MLRADVSTAHDPLSCKAFVLTQPVSACIEGQLAAYKSFCELWDSGEMAKLDNFDGFQMLFRVHAPGAGRVTILFKADSDAQIFEHFAPWRAQFGIEMDFTPVIGCQDVVDYHKKLFAKMS